MEQHRIHHGEYAVYGEDYEVSRNGLPLIYSPERQEFYASNDELMVKPITRDVARTSTPVVGTCGR